MRDERKTKSELIEELAVLRDRVTELEGLVTEHYGIREPGYHRHYDPVTGLPGKALFEDRLSMAMSHAARNKKGVVVMVVNVNDLAKIARSLGGNAGNKLMKTLAERLQNGLRKADTIARVDENDFALVLLDILWPKNVAEVAGKILSIFRKPYVSQDHSAHVKVNIGIALYPKDGDESPILLENAYSAMEHARKIGENTFYYFQIMRNIDKLV